MTGVVLVKTSVDGPKQNGNHTLQVHVATALFPTFS